MFVHRPTTVLDQITALRKEIAHVRRTSGTGGGAISEGSLTIQGHGSLRMLDADGTELAYLGPGPDGRQVMQFRRQGGGDIFATYTSEEGRFGWALSAKNGEVVVADDLDAGNALARPWIPVPLTPVRPQDLPVVTNSEFETVIEAQFTKTHPHVTLSTLDTCEDGTSGEGRILITSPDGHTTTADTWELNAHQTWKPRGPYLLPGIAYSGLVTVAVQWRRISGRDPIRATATGLVQRESTSNSVNGPTSGSSRG